MTEIFECRQVEDLTPLLGQEKSMKTAIASSVLLLSVGFSGAAFAQATPDAAAAPTSRAEVKAETRSAEQSGQIPRGEASDNMDKDTSKSIANRADVKATTKTAEKSGQLARGEASRNMDSQNSKSTSTLTKAQRKAAARTAEKNHEIPRGESNVNN